LGENLKLPGPHRGRGRHAKEFTLRPGKEKMVQVRIPDGKRAHAKEDREGQTEQGVQECRPQTGVAKSIDGTTRGKKN